MKIVSKVKEYNLLDSKMRLNCAIFSLTKLRLAFLKLWTNEHKGTCNACYQINEYIFGLIKDATRMGMFCSLWSIMLQSLWLETQNIYWHDLKGKTFDGFWWILAKVKILNTRLNRTLFLQVAGQISTSDYLKITRWTNLSHPPR